MTFFPTQSRKIRGNGWGTELHSNSESAQGPEETQVAA